MISPDADNNIRKIRNVTDVSCAFFFGYDVAACTEGFLHSANYIGDAGPRAMITFALGMALALPAILPTRGEYEIYFPRIARFFALGIGAALLTSKDFMPLGLVGGVIIANEILSQIKSRRHNIRP